MDYQLVKLTNNSHMLKLKEKTSASKVFDRVKELLDSETVYIKTDAQKKAWVTKVVDNIITCASAEYNGQSIVRETIKKDGQTITMDDVNKNYELGVNEDGTALLIRKQSMVGGGKTRAPGKRVIGGRARVVYVGPRGGEYIKKDGKFVRI